MRQKVLISTLTNLSYGIAGAFLISNGIYAIGGASIILALLSGYHHYRGTDFTRALDYLGMYLVCTALFVTGFGLPGAMTAIIAGAAGTGIMLIFKVSRVAVGLSIAAVLVQLGAVSNLFVVLTALMAVSIAFGFNYMGDNLHKDHHDFIHGIWHNVTGWVIAYCGLILSNINIISLL